MEEHPHWPTVQIQRVANGWIVEQGRSYQQSHMVQPLEEVRVFELWEDVSEFVKVVTLPTRPPT